MIKPSEFTSASMLEFAKLFAEAGFPKGVVNVVTGFGGEVGAHEDAFAAQTAELCLQILECGDGGGAVAHRRQRLTLAPVSFMRSRLRSPMFWARRWHGAW